jgi:hypothetical protein
VLGRADRPSSQVASLSTVVELLKAWVDAVVAHRVRWGTRSLLVTALSYFLELDAKLELLGSGRNAALMEDQVVTECQDIVESCSSVSWHFWLDEDWYPGYHPT